MKAVEVQFSLELLRKFLHLPDDVRLTKVEQSYTDLQAGRFSVIVEGPSLPIVGVGQPVPWGYITIHNQWCDAEERTHIERGEVKAA